MSSRLFPFPPARVFDAFADPAKLARWWGPHGASNEFHEFGFHAGGRCRFTMKGPWGALPMENAFVAVEPARRVVVHHRQEGHTFTLDIRLQAVPGGTRMTWRTTFETPAQLAAVREAFAKGNEENFDRLMAVLREGVRGNQGSPA